MVGENMYFSPPPSTLAPPPSLVGENMYSFHQNTPVFTDAILSQKQQKTFCFSMFLVVLYPEYGW
jgi:hypothetical protein